MSSKGYALESEIEDFFLSFTGQNKHDPILISDDTGLIRLNRTFRIPTSGAMDSMAGDVITCIPWIPKQFKVECKSRYYKTKKDGSAIMFEHEWVTKNNEEADADDQMPLLVFSFKRVKKDRLWWVLKEQDLQKLIRSVSFSSLTKRYHRIVGCYCTVNKKGDKTKFSHKDLSSVKEGIQTIMIDKEIYVLVRHEDFRALIQSHKTEHIKKQEYLKEREQRRAKLDV